MTGDVSTDLADWFTGSPGGDMSDDLRERLITLCDGQPRVVQELGTHSTWQADAVRAMREAAALLAGGYRVVADPTVPRSEVHWRDAEGNLLGRITNLEHGGVPADSAPEEETPRRPTDAEIDDACMWYRHDYGLMDDAAANLLRHKAIEWLRAWIKVREEET